MSNERPPDYILKLNPKDKNLRDFNHHVGAGWTTKYGGISIILNPGIVLSYETLEDFFLILSKPKDEDKSKNKSR